MKRVRRREADRMLRMENMVEVVPLTQLGRSMDRNTCTSSELDLQEQCISRLRPSCVRLAKLEKALPTALHVPR